MVYIQGRRPKQNYLKHAGGSLGNSGGELTFKETGIYTVYAIASDKTGRTYTEQAVITDNGRAGNGA